MVEPAGVIDTGAGYVEVGRATAQIFVGFVPVAFDIDHLDIFTFAAREIPCVVGVDTGRGGIEVVLVGLPVRGSLHGPETEPGQIHEGGRGRGRLEIRGFNDIKVVQGVNCIQAFRDGGIGRQFQLVV